jgi:23S rRNA (cytidine1920-2'-O)/16S rRNA (cytidine1409-2'-O)-methyltransferase
MAPQKERLDTILVARGLASSRTQAQALLLAGRVTSSGVRLDKAGTRLSPTIPLEVKEGRTWVGRGGHKLAGALPGFGISAEGRDALDVGASTGGFTQVLLDAGAARVIALDVGRGQLDWGLRNDPRVHVIEGLNARYLAAGDLPFAPSLATIDVSFISLDRVLPPVVASLQPGGEFVALIKPQFEVGRRSVGRGGIVRDPGLHRQAIEGIVALVRENGWSTLGVRASTLRGAEGNREFFIHIRPGGDDGLTGEPLGAALDAALADEPDDSP